MLYLCIEFLLVLVELLVGLVQFLAQLMTFVEILLVHDLLVVFEPLGLIAQLLVAHFQLPFQPLFDFAFAQQIVFHVIDFMRVISDDTMDVVFFLLVLLDRFLFAKLNGAQSGVFGALNVEFAA